MNYSDFYSELKIKPSTPKNFSQPLPYPAPNVRCLLPVFRALMKNVLYWKACLTFSQLHSRSNKRHHPRKSLPSTNLSPCTLPGFPRDVSLQQRAEISQESNLDPSVCHKLQPWLAPLPWQELLQSYNGNAFQSQSDSCSCTNSATEADLQRQESRGSKRWQDVKSLQVFRLETAAKEGDAPATKERHELVPPATRSWDQPGIQARISAELSGSPGRAHPSLPLAGFNLLPIARVLDSCGFQQAEGWEHFRRVTLH